MHHIVYLIRRKIAVETRIRSSGVALTTREVYMESKKFLNKLLVSVGLVLFLVLLFLVVE